MTTSRRDLARHSSFMLAGQGGRVIVQALYFIIVARSLGPELYGGFVSVAAAAAVVSPFCSLGMGNLLVKRTAVDPTSFARYWGNALFVTVVSAVALGACVSLVVIALFPDLQARSVIALVAADLLFSRLTDVSAQAFQGLQRMGVVAALTLLPNAVRLLAALWLQATNPSLDNWATMYLMASMASAAIAVVVASVAINAPRQYVATRSEFAEGSLFSVSVAAQTIYNDIDKTMLARLGDFRAAGLYTTAYRLIDVAFTPIRALLASTYAEFFKRGEMGLDASAGLARKLALPTVGYGVICSAGLFLAAPVVPSVLGADFESAVSAVRLLAVIPTFRAVHVLAADALTGAGHQRDRTALQFGAAGLNVLANLALIPSLSWKGAVYASLATDACLAVGLVALLCWLLHRQSVASTTGVTSRSP